MRRLCDRAGHSANRRSSHALSLGRLARYFRKKATTSVTTRSIDAFASSG